MEKLNAVNDDNYKPLIDGKAKQSGMMTNVMLMGSQIGALLVWTFFAQYDEGMMPGTTKKPVNSNVYPCFQDVNVMIFIGFGYLMTYIKAAGQSTLSYNWIISIWCIQWGIISQQFF
jgi:hypothetical protein